MELLEEEDEGSTGRDIEMGIDRDNAVLSLRLEATLDTRTGILQLHFPMGLGQYQCGGED